MVLNKINKNMTTINEVYKLDWKIGFNDCYSNGKLSYISLIKFLQDSAMYHAESSGFGIDVMKKNNQAWVITRFSLEVLDLPELDDSVRVETWISFVRGAFSNREYVLYLNDRAIAMATSNMTVINFVERKIEKLQLDTGKMQFNSQMATRKKAMKININEEFNKLSSFEVKFSALDMIQHVSNLKYIEWVFDNVDYKKILKSQLNTITVNYIKELKLNDDVEISSFIEGNSEIIKIQTSKIRFA